VEKQHSKIGSLRRLRPAGFAFTSADALPGKPHHCPEGYWGSRFRPVADGARRLANDGRPLLKIHAPPLSASLALSKNRRPFRPSWSPRQFCKLLMLKKGKCRATCRLNMRRLSGYLLREEPRGAIAARRQDPGGISLHSSFSLAVPRSADFGEDRATKEAWSIVERTDLPRREGALR
jgi:hypothetical protein